MLFIGGSTVGVVVSGNVTILFSGLKAIANKYNTPINPILIAYFNSSKAFDFAINSFHVVNLSTKI
jgi:hypothetical protein